MFRVVISMFFFTRTLGIECSVLQCWLVLFAVVKEAKKDFAKIVAGM